MNISRRPFYIALSLVLLSALAWSQYGRRRGAADYNDPRANQDSYATPMWKNEAGFERDVFTFVRIQYGTYNRRSSNGIWMGGRRWTTDWPDADLNISYRLQQMTSMKVDPNGRCMEISDPELFRYPFIYIVEPGDLSFADEEVPILRKYLLNGGFLMVDDFWGEDEWENFATEIKRVFPDREITDIPRTHPLFHCVFDIPNDLNLQLPNIRLGTDSQYNGGVTWERSDAQECHIRGITDNAGRLCVVICHNTDNGDGWEREGENEYYFREFSEKKAYPLGINIIFYALTH
jgi:Domain of unknown function (DUF4159)